MDCDVSDNGAEVRKADRVVISFRGRGDSVPILLHNKLPRGDRVLGVNR